MAAGLQQLSACLSVRYWSQILTTVPMAMAVTMVVLVTESQAPEIQFPAKPVGQFPAKILRLPAKSLGRFPAKNMCQGFQGPNSARGARGRGDMVHRSARHVTRTVTNLVATHATTNVARVGI